MTQISGTACSIFCYTMIRSVVGGKRGALFAALVTAISLSVSNTVFAQAPDCELVNLQEGNATDREEANVNYLAERVAALQAENQKLHEQFESVKVAKSGATIKNVI